MEDLHDAIQRLGRALDQRHSVPAKLPGRELTEIILDGLRDVERRLLKLERANGIETAGNEAP
jgi:hypothetical protein